MKKSSPNKSFQYKSRNFPINVPNCFEHKNMSPVPQFSNTGRKAKGLHGPRAMVRLRGLQSQLNAVHAAIHCKPCTTSETDCCYQKTHSCKPQDSPVTESWGATSFTGILLSSCQRYDCRYNKCMQ